MYRLRWTGIALSILSSWLAGTKHPWTFNISIAGNLLLAIESFATGRHDSALLFTVSLALSLRSYWLWRAKP